MQSPNSVTVATASATKPITRKKPTLKQDESDKITEKVEGGIIVRRYKARKIEIEIEREKEREE